MNIANLAEHYRNELDATLPERLMAESIITADTLCHEFDHLEEYLENALLDDGIPSSIVRQRLHTMRALVDAFREELKEEY